jgi:hypothetical protein
VFAIPVASRAGENAVLTVNGEAVTADEFCWYLERQRASVIRDVNRVQGGDYGRGFWDRDCGGTTPRSMIMQRTTDRVVREKVQQGLFKQLGLIQDTSYSTFLGDLDRVNRARQQSVRDGHVIYGPVTYTATQYYEYWKANMQTKAKANLAGGRMDLSEEKVLEFYEAHKDSLFRRSPRLSLELVTVQPRADSQTTRGRQAAQSVASQVLGGIRAGKSADEIVRECAVTTQVRVSSSQLDRATLDHVGELLQDEEGLARAKALAPGQVVEWTAADQRILIIKCLSKDPEGPCSYQEVRDQARERYIDEQYERLVSELVQQAAITARQEELARIELD